jgi:redox-sensitive bicupin YhaK (pirin superfamily)
MKVMNSVIHKSEDRGIADHGWLQARHSFSFGGWYNPEKTHFGVLRVLNDDTIAPSAGFPTHPHDNMEIITIPLSGGVKHKDNTGSEGVINTGEVQIMSAGTGILHSEFNASTNEELRLFQIWIIPNERNVSPRYDQTTYELETNTFVPLVGPKENNETQLWVHQNAWIHIAEIDAGNELNYEKKEEKNGIYIMNIEGSFTLNGETLENRDAIGISEFDKIPIIANEKSKVLLLEVPMY